MGWKVEGSHPEAGQADGARQGTWCSLLGVQVAKAQLAKMCLPVYSQWNSLQGLGKQEGQVGAIHHVARGLRASRKGEDWSWSPAQGYRGQH